MKDLVTAAVKRGLAATGHYTRLLARTSFPGVVVLGYHGVRPDEWPDGTMAFENLHVRASVFDAQCAMVRESCHPISLQQWRDAIAGRAVLPARPVLITFDDGYRNVSTVAAPILARHGLPAVVFACSDPSAHRRLLWFDHVAANEGETAANAWKTADYEAWRTSCVATSPVIGDDDPRALLTPGDITELSRQDGIEFGVHTARHPILANATPARQREEIVECRDALREWTGKPVTALAYPNGRPDVDYTPDTIAILRDLEFDIAFTMRPAFALPTEPAFERSRFLIVAEVSAPELAHRMAVSWAR